jgi:hypothetical protein
MSYGLTWDDLYPKSYTYKQNKDLEKIMEKIDKSLGNNHCPLCGLTEREPENILIQDELAVLVRTKKLKGHKERLMIVAKEHGEKLIWQHYTHKWDEKIMDAFNYTNKLVVLDGKYGSIPEHWHVCLTDLEEGSEDHKQILGTPWLSVKHLRDWK